MVLCLVASTRASLRASRSGPAIRFLPIERVYSFAGRPGAWGRDLLGLGGFSRGQVGCLSAKLARRLSLVSCFRHQTTLLFGASSRPRPALRLLPIQRLTLSLKDLGSGERTRVALQVFWRSPSCLSVKSLLYGLWFATFVSSGRLSSTHYVSHVNRHLVSRRIQTSK